MLAFVSILALACGGGGSTEYEVVVSFNTEATQDDLDGTGAVLASYDEDVEYLIQESFPPTGRAFLETDVPDFCVTIEVELARSYVDGVTCEER